MSKTYQQKYKKNKKGNGSPPCGKTAGFPNQIFMKATGKEKFQTGIFIILAFAVLLLILYFVGKQKDLFTPTFTVEANFRNVSGLQVGNFVRFAGINIGRVNDIAIENDTSVQVEMILKQRDRKYLRADSRASIGTDGLMGDKLVQIARGTDSAGPLRTNRILGITPPNMDFIMGRLGQVASDAQVISSNLAGILYKVNNGQGSLGELLNSDKLGKNMEATMLNANKTVRTINQAATGLNENMNAVQHSFLLRGYFRKKAKKQIADSIHNVRQAAADSLKAQRK